MLNISLNPASEARLRSLAELAGTDVNAYVLRLIELVTEQGNRPPATPAAPLSARPIGLARDTFRVPATFFEPLPKDLIEAFEGSAR